MRSFSYEIFRRVGEFEPRLASSVDDFDRPRVLARTRAYSRARCRAVAAPVDFKLCTDVRKYRLSAQNEISLFFHQGNSESRYKERRTRFFRRIPHFPRSRGARAPGMWLFLDKSSRLDKSNSISFRIRVRVRVRVRVLPEVSCYSIFESALFSKVHVHVQRCTRTTSCTFVLSKIHLYESTKVSIFEGTPVQYTY